MSVATVESIATVGVVVPVTEIPVPAVRLVTGAVPFEAAVILPCASTVMDELVYEPAVTVVFASARVGVVVPVTVICPAVPVTLVTGAVPLDAAVSLPYASTVMLAFV